MVCCAAMELMLMMTPSFFASMIAPKILHGRIWTHSNTVTD